MVDRLLITFIVIAGSGLLWFAWQLYKARLMQSIQASQTLANKPNLLYFTADFCATCKFQQAPIIEQISTKFGDAIAVTEVDVSRQPQLASQYKVLTLPTTVVLDAAGQVKHINYGVTPQAKLELQLN
jgi:thioredoxin 1